MFLINCQEIQTESCCWGLASPDMPESADLSITVGICTGRGGAKILFSSGMTSSSWKDCTVSNVESIRQAAVGENLGISICFLGKVALNWTDIPPLTLKHTS